MLYIMGSLKSFFILLIPYILVEIVICIYYKSREVKITKGFAAGWLVFASMFTAMVYITGAAGINETCRAGLSLIRFEEINLIPFYGCDIFGLGMNVLLFVPLGAFAPLLWQSCTDFKETLISGLIFSLIIEISQLFNYRATDINDLIMNTLGTASGYGLYYLFFHKVSFLKLDDSFMKNGAVFNIAVLYVFYFFIGSVILNLI